MEHEENIKADGGDCEIDASDARGDAAEPRTLSPAARRALAEAEARRAAQRGPELPVELGGRDGPEPTRFGDWERKGLTSDF